MKTLVTHINPHLDDIAAIWLFQRFHPDFKDSRIEFISAGQSDQVKEDEDTIYLGVGRGQFDEHKGDLEDCATSLSFKYLKKQDFTPQEKAEAAALEELVEWARLIDLARMPEQDFDDFSVQAFIRSTDNTQEGSLKTTQLGEEILDRILKVLIKKHHSLEDWQKRVEFSSRFGKSKAVVSEYVNRPFCYKMSGDLFLIVDPKNGDTQFCTHNRAVDLEPLYNKLRELEPKASWFLHQSHQMVICGSGSAPDSVRTKLSFEQLIEIVKEV